jgi:hypothetical protein
MSFVIFGVYRPVHYCIAKAVQNIGDTVIRVAVRRTNNCKKNRSLVLRKAMKLTIKKKKKTYRMVCTN